MGRKKPAAASGTWVLLAAVVGRLWGPVLPATLAAPATLCMPPLRHRAGSRDCVVVVVVAMDVGREGGRPGSPTGPVMPEMRLPAE
jgi:hypothetical protein